MAIIRAGFVWKIIDHKWADFEEAFWGFKSDKRSTAENSSTLSIFYRLNLEQTQAKILAAGGSILGPAFSFPSARRFHFVDPNGNEFAV